MQTALDFLYGNSRTNSSSPKYEFVALMIVLVVIFFYLLPTRSNYIFPDYYDCDNEGGRNLGCNRYLTFTEKVYPVCRLAFIIENIISLEL